LLALSGPHPPCRDDPQSGARRPPGRLPLAFGCDDLHALCRPTAAVQCIGEQQRQRERWRAGNRRGGDGSRQEFDHGAARSISSPSLMELRHRPWATWTRRWPPVSLAETGEPVRDYLFMHGGNVGESADVGACDTLQWAASLQPPALYQWWKDDVLSSNGTMRKRRRTLRLLPLQRKRRRKASDKLLLPLRTVPKQKQLLSPKEKRAAAQG